MEIFLTLLSLLLLITGLIIVPSTKSQAAVPDSEREALLDLYNSTGGNSWTNKTGWLGSVGTECSWYGITCIGDTVVILNLYSNNLTNSIPPSIGNLTGLSFLNFHNNNLSGSIPPEIGSLSSLSTLSLTYNNFSGSIPVELANLTNLGSLGLTHNQLTGTIPVELTDLTNLYSLDLSLNQLSGSIPPGIGNLTGLTHLILWSNQLSGPIPSELGNLSSLQYLNISSNKLAGQIPDSLLDLTTLRDYSSSPISYGIDIRWNALYTENPSLQSFLESKQNNTDWESTQTIAPENVVIGTITNASISLSWDAILYTANGGGYEVYASTTSGGPYTLQLITADKTVQNTEITGLTPGTTYYFVLRSKTDPHGNNQNTVLSDYSSEVSATTLIPDIQVTDPVAPVDDLTLDFGLVTVALSSQKTVTITNEGTDDLTIGAIASVNPLSSPFSISTDNCSGYTLAPTDSCSVSIDFTPVANVIYSDTFDIPSNDPDETSVTMTLAGEGVPAPVSDIEVTDSYEDSNDHQIAFGGQTVGLTSSAELITVTNVGTSQFSVFEVVLTGDNTDDFQITVSNPLCNPSYEAPLNSCTIEVTFAPLNEGLKTATVHITTDDPDQPTVDVQLTGTGTPASANNPPPVPELLSPANGQHSLGSTVTLKWKTLPDPDGDPVTFNVFVDDEPDFAGAVPVQVAFKQQTSKKTLFARFNISALFIGFVLVGGLSRRRKTIALTIAALLMAGMLLASCGTSNSQNSNPGRTVKYEVSVSDLIPSTTYYWKVVAEDGKGGITESDIWQFTVSD